MRMFCLVTIGCVFCIGLALLACTEPPGYGFIVHSVLIDETGPFQVISNQVGQTLSGGWLSDSSGAPEARQAAEHLCEFGRGNCHRTRVRSQVVFRSSTSLSSILLEPRLAQTGVHG